ncbi:poly-gamma-glutamate hydrolase family protein [Sulfitobacter sp. EE-36]|uniref:poly-gamma-glutamate hydrolase family protein n=1 Tax=Sulfitobacter TaxID=60136 RepID=UPI000066D075|nr:poly-gamma-glutamate hydrolase family protein [Sulfitobacter sp. EE-36]EAP83343.1 phage replication-like protein [Sulfitobacter sp. EE-36]
MADRYPDFATLAAAHDQDRDYRITVQDRGTCVVILAPHGGTIEPETASIARAVAGNDLSFYLFEALRAGAHGDYHITSHRFDEPRALALVAGADTSIAIHGRKDDGNDTVWLGGRDETLRDAVGDALRAAGFEAALNTALPGVHPSNICNRTRSGAGVQLELPRSLRRNLAEDGAMMARFSTALRAAISVAGLDGDGATRRA